MLASITPLGERGRQSRWGVTVVAFAIGASIAGAGFGALLGGVGAAVLGCGGSAHVRLVVLAAGVLGALSVDLLPMRVPGPRRQVNERWLDEFRGWVYGFGFGAQLGLGITTIVTSAATYVAMLAALLSGSAARGALVLGCYGAVRGVTPLLTAHVSSPDQLVMLHQRLDRWRGLAARACSASLAGVLVAAVGWLA